MIWKDCDLQKQVGQQTDVLGNLVGGEWQTIMATCARQTPWTNINTESGDRTVTHNEQWFVLPVPFDNFPDATHAMIDGKRQRVIERIDLAPRYTAIRVEMYKE